MIDFGVLEGIYQGLKFTKATFLVYYLLLLLVFIIACLKIAKANYEESKKGFSYKSFIEIAKPILPFYLAFSLIPLLSTSLEFIISRIFSLIGEFSELDTGEGDLMAYKNEITEELQLKILAAYNDSLLGSITSPIEIKILKIQLKIETFFLDLIGEINRYMFTFAVSVYFMWLLIVEAFSAVGGLGFIYKEFKDFSTSWIKNFIAVKGYLAAIVVANLISIGVYSAYRQVGDYNLIVHIILFIALRGYLYKQALSISKSIL